MTQAACTIRSRSSTLWRVLGVLAAVVLFFVLLVEGVARLTWRLSGAGQTRLADLAQLPAPTHTTTATQHTLSEWPAQRPRLFHDAPMLAERVRRWELPPVERRLPLEPQIVTPPEQLGPYGGTWRRFATDPADIQTYVVHRIPYPNMLRWDPMARTLLPNLATRWTIEDNARTFTFWLRRGVRWSDGHPFTTDDIMFWFEHVLQNEDLTPSIAREYKRGGELMQVEKVNEYVIRFKFKEPNGRFLDNMAAMPGYEMIENAAHYFKRYHPDFTPIAQLNAEAKAHGFDFWYQYYVNLRDWQNPDAPRLWPWVVVKPPPARPIVLERNPYFWRVDPAGNQLPYIDRITFEIYDPETINLKALNGEIGMQARHIKYEYYPLFMANRAQGRYRVLRWIDSGGGTNNLAVNMNTHDAAKRTLFADPRFRIALSLAMNREEINQACFFGLGTPRQCAPPPTSAFYSEAYERAYTRYAPREANRLLDELGLTRRNRDGIRLLPDGRPLTLQIDCIAMASSIPTLQLVAEQWTAVGVQAEVKVLARQLFYQRKKALMHDAAVWFGADEQNPLLDPRWFFPWKDESNFGIAYAAWFRSNGKKGERPPPDMQRCMDLYRQIEVTPDPAEQRRLFMQIIELNRRNLWVIGTIGETPVLYIVKDSFRNVPEVAVSGWQFRGPANTAPECYAIEEERR